MTDILLLCQCQDERMNNSASDLLTAPPADAASLADGASDDDVGDGAFVILQDTREQTPYTFRGLRLHGKPIDIPVEVATLQTGDYSVKGLESEICVERKSVSDFYGTITRGRERFERELARMANMKRAAVMVEGRFTDLASDPLFFGSRINPESVTGSVASFFNQYGVPCFFLHGRDEAEAFTFKLLHKYFKRSPLANVENVRRHREKVGR